MSCILDIAAIFFDPLKEAAHIVDMISDCFTFSVAGCIGAQIYHEINKDNAAGEIPRLKQCPHLSLYLCTLLTACRALCVLQARAAVAKRR